MNVLILVQFLLVAVLAFWYRTRGLNIPFATWFMIPVILLWLGVLAMGLGILVSSFTTKYRDLAMLVSFGLQLWHYATPIAYGLSLIPDRYLPLILLNPMTMVIVTFRKAFFGTGYFSLPWYLVSWALTLLVLAAGVLLFGRVERTFMDTI